MEDARDAGSSTGVRARRPLAQSSPDRAVDGAYRALRATVARGVAYRMGSSEEAEDLTQDVFVDLLLAARCRPPSNTRAWLARVAQRHVADTIGSAVRERALRARLEAASRNDPLPVDPDVLLSIRASMASLSESQQRIIALRLLQGRSFAHCGLVLGMSEDAARMRFGRALCALRRELVSAGLEGS